MKTEQVNDLRRGAIVQWNDPDHGLTSRRIIVDHIEWMNQEEGMVIIHGDNFFGEDCLECFAHELEMVV